jgi:hypothetical protein
MECAMIRGSIEIARRTQVSGWIFAESGLVRDRLILAFSGERCVGAGKVDRFRKDLLEAKLGDGYCGFDFAIKLNDEESSASVIVKLQNSDVALIQRASRLIGQDDSDLTADETDMGAISPAMLPWMQDRGWLDQHEYDFVKSMHMLGAYERGLRPARRTHGETAPGLLPSLKPEHVAQELLSLFVLGEVELRRSKLASVSDLAAPTSPLYAPGVPLLALWSPERCRLALDERSHASQAGGAGKVTSAPAAGAIEYGFGPDRMLFLHRHASFAPHGPAPAAGIVVFTATERRASAAKSESRAA